MRFKRAHLSRVGLAVLCAAAWACGGASRGPAGDSGDKRSVEERGGGTEDAQIEFIAETVNRLGADIRECYARAIADDLHLSGTLTLMATLKGEGRAAVDIAEDRLGDAQLAACVLSLWEGVQWSPVFASGVVIQLPPISFVEPDTQVVIAPEMLAWQDKDGVQEKILLRSANTGNPSPAVLTYRKGDVCRSQLPDTKAAGSIVGLVKGSLELVGYPTLASGDLMALPGSGSAAYKECRAAEVVILSQEGTQGFEKPARASVVKPFKDLPETQLGLHTRASARQMELPAGAATQAHKYDSSTLYMFVLQGNAKIHVGETSWFTQIGEAVHIPPGVGFYIQAGQVPFRAFRFLVTPVKN